MVVAALLSCFVLSAPSSAQQISEAEIQRAVDAMRAAGQSEDQIQQFLKSIETINALQIQSPPGGASQASDIQAITGMSDKEMKAVAPIAGAIKARQNQQFAGKLREKIAAFEKRFEGKPDISASFDGSDIRLKLIDCHLEQDAYVISAQAAPTQHNRSGLRIGANRGWSAMNGEWAASISVQVDGENFRTNIQPDLLTQPNFSFDGLVTSQKTSAEKHLRFDVKCEG